MGAEVGSGGCSPSVDLNHTPPKTDVLHRHYVGLSDEDVADGLKRIQDELGRTMQDVHQTA